MTIRLAKTALAAAVLAMALPQAAAQATVGPHASVCDNGSRSVTVRVTGFRARTGQVRVQLYAANPATFLERGQYLQRVDVPLTASGDMDVCVPVPAAGRYAVSVRHDANGNGRSDRADGGGFSGNPQVSLLDMALRRKPSLERVGFAVSNGNVRQSVVLNYVQGTSFRPIARN